jgi:hypothetical protein
MGRRSKLNVKRVVILSSVARPGEMSALRGLPRLPLLVDLSMEVARDCQMHIWFDKYSDRL